MERVRNLSDTVVGLESFISSERETNQLYKDYHGKFHPYCCKWALSASRPLSSLPSEWHICPKVAFDFTFEYILTGSPC